MERSAEAFFTHLPYEDQQVVRDQLLRMVRPGVGSTEFTSSRLRLLDAFQGAAASDRVARVLYRLVFEERLLKLTGVDPKAIAAILQSESSLAVQLGEHPDAQIEVAHEALVRNWPRLVSWLDEERETLRQRFRLREAATAWQQQGRSPDLLWRGAQLAAAAACRDLNEVEGAFVEAGHAAEAAAELAEHAARERALELEYAQQLAAAEQRNSRRLRWLLALSGALLVAAVALLVYAIDAGQAAADGAAEAKRQAAAQATMRAVAVTNEAEAQRQAELAVVQQMRADQNAATAEQEKANAEVQRQRARGRRDGGAHAAIDCRRPPRRRFGFDPGT